MTIESPSPPPITDPAAAVAASKCYLARVSAAAKMGGRGLTEAIGASHPRSCEWCPYPTAILMEYLERFNEWAGFDPKTGTYSEPEVKRYAGLPRQEQRARSHHAAYDLSADL